MPPRKRRASQEKHSSDHDSADGARTGKKARVSKREDGAGTGTGEVFWELSGKRRVGIQEFGGKKLVNIREYYEKDGGWLPSKKGISLPVEQFNALIKLLPQIEASLSVQGVKIERPDYDGAGASAAVDDDDEVEPEVRGKAKGKRNFEETSEEE